MSIFITFACGHQATVLESSLVAPTCACGEHRVQHVKARAPRFTGACSGPYAEMKTLEPIRVPLAPKGALRLKEPSE